MAPPHPHPCPIPEHARLHRWPNTEDKKTRFHIYSCDTKCLYCEDEGETYFTKEHTPILVRRHVQTYHRMRNCVNERRGGNARNTKERMDAAIVRADKRAREESVSNTSGFTSDDEPKKKVVKHKGNESAKRKENKTKPAQPRPRRKRNPVREVPEVIKVSSDESESSFSDQSEEMEEEDVEAQPPQVNELPMRYTKRQLEGKRLAKEELGDQGVAPNAKALTVDQGQEIRRVTTGGEVETRGVPNSSQANEGNGEVVGVNATSLPIAIIAPTLDSTIEKEDDRGINGRRTGEDSISIYGVEYKKDRKGTWRKAGHMIKGSTQEMLKELDRALL